MWYGLAPSPPPLPQLIRELLLLLLNVHDNTHELTGRFRPPAFIPRAPSTRPTAPFMIYPLHEERGPWFDTCLNPLNKKYKGNNISCSRNCKTHSLRKHPERDDENNALIAY